MKDLCTLDLLPELIEAGINSLKIEGRMKSPRYTAGVVHVYRKYVDQYFAEGRAGYQVDPADRQMLLDLFDRGGFTEGYYKRHNGPDMIARKEKPAFRQGNQELFDRLDRLYVQAEKKEPVTASDSGAGAFDQRAGAWQKGQGPGGETSESPEPAGFSREAGKTDPKDRKHPFSDGKPGNPPSGTGVCSRTVPQ